MNVLDHPRLVTSLVTIGAIVTLGAAATYNADAAPESPASPASFDSYAAPTTIASLVPTAPNTSPTPPSAGGNASSDTPDQVVMSVARGFSKGQPQVLWDALPASYQDDLTDIVHSYAAGVDPELWNQGFAIVGKLGRMLKNKKDLILAMPKIQAASGFNHDRASREWDLVVAPFITITQSDLADVRSLQTMDVRAFLSTTGVQFMQDIVKLSELSEGSNNLASIGQLEATLVSMEGDSALVRITQPGQPEKSEPFVRVQGKWIPQSMADDWTIEMQSARAKIAQMSPEKVASVKPQIMTILAGIDGTIDQLDQAQTAQQFEQTLQMGAFQVFGGMMEVAQAMESGPEAP